MPNSRQEKVFGIGKLLDLCHEKGWDSLDDQRETLLMQAATPWLLGRRTVREYVDRVRELLAYEKKTGKPAILTVRLSP